MIIFTIPEVPDELPPFVMRTPTQYILMDHLAAKLVTTDKTGQIVSDLASAWNVSEDFTEFKFRIGKSKWSDGTALDAGDVVRHFKNAMAFGSATHIDFSNFASVSKSGNDTVVIKLKSPDAGLLMKLRCPECGILKYKANNSSEVHWKVTSGAYFLSEKGTSSYILEKNKYYRHFENGAVSVFEFRNLANDAVNNLEDLHSDFSFSPKGMNHLTHGHMLSKFGYSTFEPKIYFSHFVTLNMQSARLQSAATREMLASDILECREGLDVPPNFESSTGLAYKDSPASVPSKDFQSIVSGFREDKERRRETIRMISIASRPFSKELAKCLESLGWKVHHKEAKTAGDFTRMVKDLGEYDIAANRVDVSSPDIEEHLNVIFNEKFPYLVKRSGKDPAQALMNEIQQLPLSEFSRRYEIFRILTKLLIRDVYMVPLFHEKMVFYYRENRLDLSGLSETYPDIRFWRIRTK